MMTPPFHLSIFNKYKNVNIGIPNELLPYISTVATSQWRNDDRRGSNSSNGSVSFDGNKNNKFGSSESKKSYGQNNRKNSDIIQFKPENMEILRNPPQLSKNNVLSDNKMNKSNHDILLSNIRSNLNKISKNNCDIIINNIIELNFHNDNDNLNDAINIIIQKILLDTLYSNIYAILCKKLINLNMDIKIHIINGYTKSINNIIDNSDNIDDNKIKLNNTLRFVCELYLLNVIDSHEIDNILTILENRVKNNKIFQLVESICIIFEKIYVILKKDNYYEKHLLIIKQIQNIDMGKRYLFIIMNLFDTMNK